VATPWAAERGLRIEELHKVNTRGANKGPVTLMEELVRPGSRSLPIPVRMIDTGAPGHRNCTSTYKVKVITKRLLELGASSTSPATVYIGISLDEIERANRRNVTPSELAEYPLLDLRLTRQDCTNIIRDAGLPIPGKSSCFFCPFHRPQTFREMRRDTPDLFDKAADLEDLLNRRRDELGKDHVYLTRFGRPLRELDQAGDELALDWEGIGETGCDEGVCFV
jgi:hypothetical protein